MGETEVIGLAFELGLIPDLVLSGLLAHKIFRQKTRMSPGSQMPTKEQKLV